MKQCPTCGAQLDDAVSFCPDCGTPLNGGTPAVAPVVDPYDHTEAYDPQDIADNKLFCMLLYLINVVGIIIALLAAPDSAYVRFHIRQSIKLTICAMLLALVTGLLAWTVIVPVLGGIALVVLLVVDLICFVRVCKGQAREVPIVCKINFLK